MSHLTNLLFRLQEYGPDGCITADAGSYTYADLMQARNCWSQHMREFGISAGALIGLRADYSFNSIAALLALFGLRAVVALIPHTGSPDSYLSDACCSALLEIDIDGNYKWQGLCRLQTPPLIERLRSADEGGLVLFTSGSTGRPKAALLSVERFLKKFEKRGRKFCTLAFLMFDHVGGLDTLFYTLFNGGTVVLTQRRDPNAVLNSIQTHRVAVLPASPSFLRLLCASCEVHQYDLSSLQVITYGAEPMDANTLARLNAMFPNVEILQKYGTTETGSPSTTSRANDSLWLSFKDRGVETKVIDDVLWIRSESSMLGYLNSPNSVDDLGWYCTGDLVDVDGDWIRFRGRLAEVVNVGGQKVSPIEVEQIILELEFVSSVRVSGEAHSLMGEIAVAHVMLCEQVADHPDSARLIREHCKTKLAPYKVPVKIFFTKDGLSNDRQKMQRRAACREQDDSAP